GAEIIYDRVVEPYLARNEGAIDGCLQHARAAAHRSSEAATLSAYDRWTGYMQRTIRQYTATAAPADETVPAAADRAGQHPPAGSGHPGLTDLLKALSQQIPRPAAHLDGVAGGAEAPAAPAGGSGAMSALASVLTSWAAPVSYGTAGGVAEQRLREIQSRQQQLQEMVAQLDRSERAILDSRKAAPAPRSSGHTGTHTDASEFEDDAVMVNEPATGNSSSGFAVALDAAAASASAKPSTAATNSPSARRWFW
ncbi:hypothetical protein H4R19_006246, partial [Coemansia spiralis]